MGKKPTLNPALKSFWLGKARNRILYGGRASSKSWDAAGIAVFLAQAYKVRFLCCRQFQNKISESVYTLLKLQIERFGLTNEFRITENSILHKRTGSEFLFYGIWRHIDEIKSLEDIDILWIEEAHNLTQEQWEILSPTIRKEGSQIWVIFNPRLSTDFVYKHFIRDTPANTVIRKINYYENPFLSQTMLDLIEATKQEDYETYRHIYLGEPREDDDGVLIRRSWISTCIDAHLKVQPSEGDWFGGVTVGYDVADDGGDKNATTVMNGSVCISLDEWKAGEDELHQSAARVKNTAIQFCANRIGYDTIGVGAGTGSMLNEMGYHTHFKFNAGGPVAYPERWRIKENVKNKDFFSNLKAQAWWTLADRFRNTFLTVTKGERFPADELISISSECDGRLIDKLIDELSTPKRDFDNAGKVKVESKKDLAKREIPSPNIADSFVIANSVNITRQPMKINPSIIR